MRQYSRCIDGLIMVMATDCSKWKQNYRGNKNKYQVLKHTHIEPAEKAYVHTTRHERNKKMYNSSTRQMISKIMEFHTVAILT